MLSFVLPKINSPVLDHNFFNTISACTYKRWALIKRHLSKVTANAVLCKKAECVCYIKLSLLQDVEMLIDYVLTA